MPPYVYLQLNVFLSPLTRQSNAKLRAQQQNEYFHMKLISEIRYFRLTVEGMMGNSRAGKF